MSDNEIIRQFEGKCVRTVWVAEEEEWYFSVVDVVGALSESTDPKQYIKRLRSRDAELSRKWGTICTPVPMKAPDGKLRKTNATNMQGILRIIQSIPSKKAEPFKLWLAQVGAERIEETIDPEIAIDRALETYLKKGYDEDWVHQRLLAIRIRNELTEEWKNRGVKEGREFAILTDEISKAWSSMTTREYKDFKRLHKENLRDNMTDTELVLSMLAEATTRDISRVEEPEGFDKSRSVAQRGGSVAGVARKAVEAETGRPVVTSMNALDFAQLVGGVIEAGAAIADAEEADPDIPHS